MKKESPYDPLSPEAKSKAFFHGKMKKMHLSLSSGLVNNKKKNFFHSQLLAFVNKRIVKFYFWALALGKIDC